MSQGPIGKPKNKINLLLEDEEKSSLVRLNKTNNSPKPLFLNLALSHLIPTKPGVNFVGTAAGFFVPGGGLIKYFGEGSVAMEGYISQSPKDAPLEQFADREGQKAAPFAFKDYQRYAHIRVVLDDWAMQIVELLNTAPEHTVQDSLPVSINPF